MNNKFNAKKIINYDPNQFIPSLTLELPNDKAKTAFASEVIAEALKSNKDIAYQHKHIIQSLEAIVDKNGERMFSIGNINGAFNYLNKNLSRHGITKYKENGGVYYKYTTDQNELEQNAQSSNLTDQLYQALNETFEISNKLKTELLTSDAAIDENVIELITKISNIELFILKNKI